MRLGVGGVVVLLVLSLIFKRDFLGMLGGGQSSGAVSQPDQPYQETVSEKNEREFITAILNDAQTTWSQIFSQMGKQWTDSHLVLFTDVWQSGCGTAESASGPFYCPVDKKVYIDLGFYDELKQKFGASGDFAQASRGDVRASRARRRRPRPARQEWGRRASAIRRASPAARRGLGDT